MNGWNERDRVVIDGLASLVDYHSLHIYTGSDDYWTNVLQPHQAERAIGYARALLQRAACSSSPSGPGARRVSPVAGRAVAGGISQVARLGGESAAENPVA